MIWVLWAGVTVERGDPQGLKTLALQAILNRTPDPSPSSWLQYEGASPPPHMILAAGMLSSSIAQFAAYPLALTRTRLQAQGAGGQPIKYAGMGDVLRKTVANEGVRGLYKVGGKQGVMRVGGVGALGGR